MSQIIKKKFYFVRHGRTDWNDRQLCQGHTDIELNEAGKAEAFMLSQIIPTFPIKTIFSSPLKRASETALILHTSIPHTTLKYDDQLKERAWGEVEGKSSQLMYIIEEQETLDPLFNPYQGVESRTQFKSRLQTGINQSLLQCESPLIVSHGRAFLILCELLNIPLIKQIPNAVLLECSPKDGNWEITQLG
jgi:broad specificity phosphatase PhoE